MRVASFYFLILINFCFIREQNVSNPDILGNALGAVFSRDLIKSNNKRNNILACSMEELTYLFYLFHYYF